MKPEWKDAPEWARWLAQDADGDWYWYQNIPYRAATFWTSNGKMTIAFPNGEAWENSLESLEDQQCPDQPA